MFDPYEHAEKLGITVIHRPLRTDLGRWYPQYNLIVIRDRLRDVHDRATLTHELGHASLGHTQSTPKHEALADRWASEMLIGYDEYRRAARWAADTYELAHELQVPPEVMRRWLAEHPLAG
ncbi:ImmA/IrrE family metallo-endopeptidase [Curtobacterium sp. C1]|uniref:ImmA/IrrE family metallo-endopeptidase n=1 Tax=Curtobacterium sp. C1 TaxID=2898151 RepID=UPI001E5803C5|nr:ImmA/IrrE family metallo-endopeptidase [Curtobacterium sp. C1]UFU14590.1 ImmA/IrrE family metallo-endopeptidase [Curtobacterium sp. C1]